MVIECRPGLILLPILQGDCIILKDISNLQTTVIERFNELLTGKHNITVFEDIHDTITKSDQKELSGFSSFSRVFGTCPPNSANKLSEDVLSGFTVINTSEYKKDEQANALKSYNIINSKNLSNEIIDLIIDFSKSVQIHFKKTMPFTKLINILEICSRLIRTFSSIPPKNILGIVLYRIFFGLLERRTEYKEKINTIFNEINVPLPSQFLNPNNESPFLITNKDGFQVLESKITGLHIHSTSVNDVDLNVAYTPTFVDMLDIIHFGISAKIPVILEGNAGQGKQKAIEYVAKHLGYEVNNIVLSKSTKVDDLLGKVSIEHDEMNNIHVKPNFTKLAKAIKSNSANNNTIFVLHNLNNASPAVLEKFTSLFDCSQNEFSLPDGTTHPKGEINVIGLFNPQNGISDREKLPTSLIYSSIYHIVENPKKSDVLNIIQALFQPTDFRNEVISFHHAYKITKKFASQNNASSAVTLYDISKYIILRTVTNGFLDKDLILKMLFGFRFLQHEINIKVLEELDLLKILQPTLRLNEYNPTIIEKLKTLTDEQGQCLLFLICAVLSKRPCIIQGSTASGKSHIIRLFAKMLGRKLNVYQMNSDSNMSIFTGQSIVKNEITEKDEKEFLIAFSDLQAFDELKAFIKKNFSIPYKEWKPKQFCELLEKINSYEKNESISDNSKELLQRAKEKIKQTMSPCKRSHHVESAFIRAMENGEWVVLEDLGSAPPEIEEKLSFLCGDNPEIDLFESGENNFFSRNKPNSRKIHEDFQIFITYNPSSNTTYREMSPNFLNKCFLFTLPPLDSTKKSSEEFLKGAFINYNYDNNLANILGKGISNVHQFIKKDCLKNKDSYATATQFTARTLTFILKEFDRHIKKHGKSIESIYKVLCRSFHLYYLNSYINTNKDIIQKQMLEELSKEIDLSEFDDKIDDVVKKEETFSEVAYIHFQINDDSKDEDDEVYEINQSDDENIIICRPSGECHQVSVDPQIFDGMIHELNERDGIEQAIHFMKTTDREKTLEILPYTSRTFEMEYLMPDVHLEVDDYPILPLMKQSFKISQEFIKVASDLDLPYSTMCVNILIDCSAFISDKNKMFNLLIICGLTDALTTLDIPYSAAVIGDQNFKAIVKPFEEPHSYRALQRISDCIHIKRFRAKLPGCIEYAINSMAFPNDERRNRAIFTFTDGLDENLVKIKGWSELFKYSQLSFGFVFIKSSELVRKNLVFLENIWDTFEKETNGKNSVVKVAKIYANLDTLGYLLELFENVMKRSNRIDDEHMIIDSHYRFPLFEIPEEERLKSINIFKKYMNEKYDDNKDLYVQRSDVLKNVKSVFDQVDSKLFYNKLNRITTCQVDNSLENEYRDFLKDFIQSGKNINRTSLKKIFKINKAPQANLLTETNIDVTALILNLINSVPDPMIYLEEKGGLIRNYGVTVVIDASYSCFNPLSSAHSFQTIKSVLVSLGSIDLPCFDLIIATNSSPIVLCSQLKTSYALAERSQLWDSLFSVLQNIHPSLHHSDLASAIHTAFDLRRMRTMECDSSMMFVLTDGLYQASERPRIIECVNNCVQFGMITFGIGMGIYPKGIEKLFPQYVFAGNPSNVMKGVSQLLTNNNFDYSDKMFCLSHSLESKDLISAMEQVSRSTERPLFALFCEELSKIIPTIDAFSDFVYEKQDTRKVVKKGFVNPQGEDTELYIKDCLRTQKILIVQLCDDTICGDPQLNKKYIFENYESGRKECINEAVKFFGITLTVVQNYEDAIHEITKSNNDLCEYYAVWIICGRHPEQLPTGQRSSNKYIVEQFIDVLIKFWKNGGSLVFWADSDPYTFHVNLFLNKVRFENEEKCPSGKVNFQIHGNHKGGKNLSGDVFGELKKEQIFNRSPQLFRDLERNPIWHNIVTLNEGKTLSFVENINVKTDSNYKEKILPFKPFAIDSDGGITILFYSANLKTGTGDIIIDCGFS
ncbi:hypothetical protein M9Y10_027933 [Tritrichomonas musculus]|uniref:ATPase dynein-related AAA domain-containing protein n=1 Tax=Tritrichomonas musculus TaxID=1915356 RepID=A0ABR2H5Q7_9EUKA